MANLRMVKEKKKVQGTIIIKCYSSLMTFLAGDEDDAHDDEDKDLTDDAAINRSISVDNENPQTPDILH